MKGNSIDMNTMVSRARDNPVKCGLIILAFMICTPAGVFAETPETERELVAAFTPTELVLDPVHSYRTQELQIATAIYEGLVSYHPASLRPVPSVAWSWDVSEDGRTYSFHLRRRAQYSNGDRVTAQDFRASWLRVISPEEQGEYSFLFDVIKGVSAFRNGDIDDPDLVGIRAESDTLLVVELNKPAGHFLSMLCHMSFVPVHPQYQDSVGWDTRPALVTNGPFTIERRSRREMILKKNEHYWDEKNVLLDRIRLRFISNAATITDGINAGEIHWAETANLQTLMNPRAVQFSPLFGTTYLYFLTDTEPWSDPRVRRGLALLISWGEIRSESGTFSTDRIVPGLEFLPDVVGIREKNIEEGLALLADAGFPEGKGLPEILIQVPSDSTAEVIAGFLKSEWEDALPLDVRVQPLDYSVYTAELKKKDFTLATSTWIGDFADPLTFLLLWTSASNLNDAHYRNAEYDRMVEDAMAEQTETRFEKLAQVEKKLLDDAVVIPLSHPASFNVVDLGKIDGWYQNFMDIHPFKTIRFKKARTRPDLARALMSR